MGPCLSDCVCLGSVSVCLTMSVRLSEVSCAVLVCLRSSDLHRPNRSYALIPWLCSNTRCNRTETSVCSGRYPAAPVIVRGTWLLLHQTQSRNRDVCLGRGSFGPTHSVVLHLYVNKSCFTG